MPTHKTTSYYRTVIGRQNLLTDTFLSAFLLICSYPRLLLEVFIRKNFGERYFRFSSVITIILILGVSPFLADYASNFTDGGDSFMNEGYSASQRRQMGIVNFLMDWGSWYAFLAAFFFMSLRRAKEVSASKSIFDFGRYTLSSGEFNEKVAAIKISGKQATNRQIETLIEPAIFLIIGGVLWFLNQKVGILLTVCSVIYSFSYMAAYRLGDNFILDKIDEVICNQALAKFLHGGVSASGENEDSFKGFRVMADIPKDGNHRKLIYPLMVSDEQKQAAEAETFVAH